MQELKFYRMCSKCKAKGNKLEINNRNILENSCLEIKHTLNNIEVQEKVLREMFKNM